MTDMDPNSITLTTPSKSFAYEKMSREIEECNDIDTLKTVLRCYVKLYFKQQETIAVIGIPDGNT
jgi:hypothetical protein|tara:strand:+ start:385 stop:579 length:195 start_codon:yes stop_codon:yes gene_type:complete